LTLRGNYFFYKYQYNKKKNNNFEKKTRQEDFSAVRDQYMRSGDGYICVFAVTIEASFIKVKELYDLVLRVKDADSVPFVIVGNKCDLEKQRKVPTSRAQALANELGS
jgi:GTPase SAR1 family protein